MKLTEEPTHASRFDEAEDHIPDLSRVEYHNQPQFAFDPSLPRELAAIAIGWLGNRVETTGRVPDETLAAIRWAQANRKVDEGWLGFHTCGICGDYFDRGEFLIQADGKNYLMPQMILHYIEAHAYCPPAEFLADVALWWQEIGQNDEDSKPTESTEPFPQPDFDL